MLRRVIAASEVAGALWAARAEAQDATVGVRLEVLSPPGCPGSAEFVREIERRRVRLRTAARDERTLAIAVSISPASGDVLGRLVLIDPQGRRSERTVTTSNCSQATEALALIASLALRHAGGDLSAPMPVPASSSATVSPTPPSGIDTSGHPEPAVSPSPISPRTDSPTRSFGVATLSASADAPRAASLPAPATTAWMVDASVSGLGAVGVGPDIIAGAAIRIGVTAPRHASFWNPSVRVALVDTLDRASSSSLGAATFGFIAGSADICPWSFERVLAGSLRPCVAAEAGVLRASGSDTLNPRNEPRTWSAAGIEGIYRASIAGPVFWDATLGALLPIDRYRFTIGQGTVFETPIVVARVAVGIGANLD